MAPKLTSHRVLYSRLMRHGSRDHSTRANETRFSLARPQRRVHWKAPTFMIGSLVIGFAFALGHHFYYRSWNHQLVRDNTQQEWITRIGTGFAFIIKMFLVIAAGTAYIQHLWASSRSHPATIDNVDSMFDVLGNAWKFLEVKLWFRRPILVILAAVPWLVPFAAVFTPATLSVDLIPHTQNFSTKVPQLDFRNTDFASINIGSVEIGGPDLELSRSSLATAIQGSILPMKPRYPNSTYGMDFHAPAIKCGNASAIYTEAFNAKIMTANTETEGAAGISYVSWPGSGNGSIPPLTVNFSPTSNDELLDIYSTDSAKVSIAVDSRLYVCSLHNASYSVTFHFSAGQQALDVRVNKYLNGVAALNGSNPAWSDKSLVWNALFNETIAYQSIMQAFGRIVIGQVNTNSEGTQNSASATVQATNLGRFVNLEDNIVPPFDAFSDAAEELFQNITMSLFSIPKYYQNAATTPLTPITVLTIPNTYIYKPTVLYLAYGLALLATLLAVILGCVDILRNGASFTNSFSTALRTTRDANFDTLVTGDDASGKDPLPKHLAKVKVSYDELGLHCLTRLSGEKAQVSKAHVDSEASNESGGEEVVQEQGPLISGDEGVSSEALAPVSTQQQAAATP